ncbi:hypothetical protein LWI29_032309 [Acer saccharum]|uniref:Plant bHLH transcription factor ACT-like domain-containing protein n=1 Tax=Acer saccharum TaxID=4024 RepID=A0AA39RZ90_ACESA|nr:hypothetical protein LWI29_032309 [Acer saccharum]
MSGAIRWLLFGVEFEWWVGYVVGRCMVHVGGWDLVQQYVVHVAKVGCKEGLVEYVGNRGGPQLLLGNQGACSAKGSHVQPKVANNGRGRPEVKVEKIGETFLVKVICKKGDQNKLVSILEVFDEMGVNVVQASVSCNYYFSMEAIVAPQNPAEAMDVRQVIQLISKAIDK